MSDWKNKIKKLDKFRIKQISIFPTYLPYEEREEMYFLLEKTDIEKIHLFHLRHDMDGEEISYLDNTFKIDCFNIHPSNGKYPGNHSGLKKYKNKIFIENLENIPEEHELSDCGGLCIDFSHWDSYKRVYPENYFNFSNMAKKFKVGCCHVSGIYQNIHYKHGKDRPAYEFHSINHLSQLDYLEKYKNYLPEIISLEIDNSLDEQMSAIGHLRRIIS